MSVFRRLSSFVLIALLTILVGVKDLALGFCLCEEALFLGKDPCSDTTSNDCTACCHHEEAEDAPCDDCIVPVQLEVEDYLWSSDSFSLQTPVAVEPQKVPTPVVSPFISAGSLASSGYKPPPPPGAPFLILQCRLLL